MTEYIELSAVEIAALAVRIPGDPVLLTLALESHGVGLGAFKLPTERLARLGFLPGWSRQNYRTAITRAVALGLIVRVGPATVGRAGARYHLPPENRLETGPAHGRAG